MKLNKLTANQVARAGPGRHGDGGGLALIVTTSPDGSLNRKWVFRFTWRGKPTECGMGGYGTTLAEARAKAAEARRLVRGGINPVQAKKAAKRKGETPTFGKCAGDLIAAKSSEWRSDVHRQQWATTLRDHAAPLWSLPVDEVDTAAVLGVLNPLWQSIPETASRLRGRIEAVLDYAKAHKYRSGENPAAWRGHLAMILPRRAQLSRGHHPAMDYRDVPALIATLRRNETMPALALEFLILCATRLGEVLGARWDEFGGGEVWTIPATRMKAGREHRVPLSGRAVEILEKLAETRHGPLVFGCSRSAIATLVPRGSTIHGFRSSFRDWAGEETSFPREIAQGCLAHVAGDATERAYRRGDALEKRRVLMEAWATFCEGAAVGNVVPLRRQAAADDR